MSSGPTPGPAGAGRRSPVPPAAAPGVGAKGFAAGVLKPLAPLPWVFFWLLTALGLAVMPAGIGAYEVGRWVGPPGLRAAALWLGEWLDALWVVLAAVNCYGTLVRTEGLATARRWSSGIIIGATVLAWVGATMAVPFGPLAYTDRLGARVYGVLPFTVPLLWLTVVIGARAAVLWAAPRAGLRTVVSGVALIALLTDLNLEPVAWRVRAYWIWYPGEPAPPPGVPFWNYLAWTVAAAVFAATLAGGRIVRGRAGRRPAVVLAAMNAVWLAVHAVGWWRR